MIEYAKHDMDINDRIQLTIENPGAVAGGVGGISKHLEKFPFQFPPRVKNDSKSINWQEENLWTYEPLAYWQGAGARSLQLEAKYVVDGGKWTGAEIMQITHAAKSYAYRSAQSGLGEGTNMGPVIRINDLYDIIGDVDGGTTWRATNISIAYGDTLVADSDGQSIKQNPFEIFTGPRLPGDPNTPNPLGFSNSLSDKFGTNVFPLVTTITFDLMSFTRISSRHSSTGVTKENRDDLIQSTNLATAPNPLWY